MPGKGLSPLVLPNLLCSQCGGRMEYHNIPVDEGKIVWSRGYSIFASCHTCKTTFDISLQHASGRFVIYQPNMNEEPEELPEVEA